MRYQEQCSCGAVLTARKWKELVFWRYDHLHEMETLVEPLQVPPTGGESHTEIHPETYGMWDRQIGFRRNEERLPSV